MEPEKLKEFKIEDLNLSSKERIGRGNFATVYKICFLNKPEVYALKKSKSCDGTETKREEETKKEISILFNIKHKNVISLFGIVYWNNRLCLILEYASFGTVYYHLHTSRQSASHEDNLVLTEELKGKIIKGVCSGIKHLHTGLPKPIRHGDIKSLNVLLCQNDNEIVAKIADFGLSDELTSTKSGDGKCSYRWSAPEILVPKNSATSKTVKSIKSDIWSLGAFVWEIWTEELPYSDTLSSSGQELLCQIIFHVGNRKMTPYSEISKSKIPEFYRLFLSNCFEFDYQKRWNIQDVCEYLDPVPLASGSSEVEKMEFEDSIQAKCAIPVEIRNRYTRACFHLTKALTEDANLFTTVKDLFLAEIPSEMMKRIQSPRELLDSLEKHALVSATETSLLKDRLPIIGEEGKRLANLFCSPISSTEQTKAVEEMDTEGALSSPAFREIAEPPQRSLEYCDNNSVEKLMSDWITRESKPGLKKVDEVLERLQEKEAGLDYKS